MMDIRERIAALGITADATETTGQVGLLEGSVPGTRSFSVTLHNPRTGRSYTTPYFMGPKADGRPDDPADVLDILSAEAASFLGAADFEDWAGDFDYNSDSRKAEAIYRATGDDAEHLRVFLGADFDAFLYDTERL